MCLFPHRAGQYRCGMRKQLTFVEVLPLAGGEDPPHLLLVPQWLATIFPNPRSPFAAFNTYVYIMNEGMTQIHMQTVWTMRCRLQEWERLQDRLQKTSWTCAPVKVLYILVLCATDLHKCSKKCYLSSSWIFLSVCSSTSEKSWWVFLTLSCSWIPSTDRLSRLNELSMEAITRRSCSRPSACSSWVWSSKSRSCKRKMCCC